jgi:hypothetical protein
MGARKATGLRRRMEGMVGCVVVGGWAELLEDGCR